MASRRGGEADPQKGNDVRYQRLSGASGKLDSLRLDNFNYSIITTMNKREVNTFAFHVKIRRKVEYRDAEIDVKRRKCFMSS